MVVKVYENASAYLNENEELLLEREAISQLVLYNAYQHRHCTNNRGGLFGVILDEDQPILHFSNIPSHNMAVYIQNDNSDVREAARLLADYTAENKIQLEGLYARFEICEAFIEQYKKSVVCTFAERMAMDIMEIRELNEIRLVDGKTRLATPDEVKLITEWMVQFQIEALTKEVDYESALVKSRRLIDDNKLYVFEDTEGNPVSMAAATRELIHGTALNYVYTPEEYRGMGYAPTNIYNISKKYLEEGNEFCTLFVDKNNMFSKRAYEKVGYDILDEIYEYKLLQV